MNRLVSGPCLAKSQTRIRKTRKLRRVDAILAIAAVSFYILCFSAAAFANEGAKAGAIGPREVTPYKSLSQIKPDARHGAYLDEVNPEHEKAARVDSYNTAIFDKSIADEMNQRYHSFYDGFEARGPYQLNERADYIRFQEANRELVDWTIKRLLQWHLDHTVKGSLEKQAKEKARAKTANNTERAAAQTVVTLSAVSKAIRGTSFTVNEKTKVRFKYDLASGMALFNLISPFADAAIDYHSRLGTRQLGGAAPEKMSIRLFRRVEEIGASTGVQYGLLSQTLNCSVQKSLVGPLSAAVSQVRNMSDASRDETTFRLDLGTHF